MVGSMRPATATSADGPANIYNAVSAAVHPKAKGRGVMLLLNDELHYAREATKTNTTQLDTFKSPNRGKAGMTNAGRVYWYDPLATKHTSTSVVLGGRACRSCPGWRSSTRYANVGRDFIDHCVALGLQGHRAGRRG